MGVVNWSRVLLLCNQFNEIYRYFII